MYKCKPADYASIYGNIGHWQTDGQYAPKAKIEARTQKIKSRPMEPTEFKMAPGTE